MVIEIEKQGHVTTVWLNRPEKRNAMGPAFWEELPAAMAQVSADPDVRAVVIAARGPCFTVGLDLMEMGGLFMQTAQGIGGRRQLLQEVYRLQAAINAVERCPVPTIAAVHGWCIGGGVDLITACDIRLGSADVRLSVRETKVAIVADLGTLQRLQRVVPRGIAAEMVYTGRDVTADECASMGLFNRVLPDAEACIAEAHDVARQIAANSPLAVRGAREVMAFSADRPVEDGLKYVALWNTAFLHSNDLVEAITAFMEKRDPTFTGE